MSGIDNISGSLVNASAQEAYQQSLTSRADIEQFQAALGMEDPNMLASEIPAYEVDPSAIANTQATTAVQQVHPGEEILQALQKTSEIHSKSVQNLISATEQIKDKDQISNADLVNLQAAMMDFQLKNDLISKASGSVSQGLQTLFRNQ